MRLLLLFFVFMLPFLNSCGGAKRVFLHADSVQINNLNYQSTDSLNFNSK